MSQASTVINLHLLSIKMGVLQAAPIFLIENANVPPLDLMPAAAAAIISVAMVMMVVMAIMPIITPVMPMIVAITLVMVW